MAESYPVVCIRHILFIHSFVGGIWVVPTFWLLWIILLWTLAHEYLSLCFQVAVLLIIYLQVELLGQMVIACLVSEEPPNCFPQYLHHFIPTRNVWGIQFLHILADTCYFPLKKKSYPRKCEVAQIYIFKGALRKQYGGWTDGGKSIRQRKQWRDGCWGMGFLSTGPRE